MRIRRVILKGVRNFAEFDYSFENSWSEEIPEALLLIGPNGSGKSTLLTSVTDLWEVMANTFGRNETHKLTMLTPSQIDLAALEIIGLENMPLWIYAAKDRFSLNFDDSHSNDYRIGVTYDEDEKIDKYWYGQPGNVTMEKLDWMLSPWHNAWSTRITENRLGKRHDLPNMIYLESESRVILPVTEKFSVQPEPEEYRWLARYEPTTGRKGSLYNYLFNLKVIDEDAFDEINVQANRFLVGKRLNGFNPRTGDLMVDVAGGGQHSITDLSSGEKQVLLMLATITRWLRPGGIVLIDEPDLHLHPSLTTAFVSHLRRMIADKDGQLIIASHATELLRDFTASHRVELGPVTESTR